MTAALLSLLLATPLPGTSIYQLDSSWTDQAGRPTRLADLRGHPVVMAMVFTHCRYACPRMVGQMKRVEASLRAAERAKVRFVLVSLDPARDTPPVLAAFARRSKLDLARWTLLRGDAGAVRELSVALGVRYKYGESGDIAHANLLTVTDADGTITHQLEGLGGEVDSVVGALRATLEGRRPIREPLDDRRVLPNP